MSREAELKELLAVMETRYRIQQQAFQVLVAEENALRSEIARLDAQARASDERADPQMRAIGADVIWKGWVGRAKAELNLKLAKVLSRKEHHIRQVRLAYGKVTVTEELLRRTQDEIRSKRTRAMLDRAIDQSVFGSGNGQ